MRDARAPLTSARSRPEDEGDQVQISAGALVQAAYAAPPLPRSTGAPADLLVEETDGVATELFSGWLDAQESVGLPSGDWATYWPDSSAELSWLTPVDREMIHATTGWLVASDGQVKAPRGRPVDPFIRAVAADRVGGEFRLELTAQYVADLIEHHDAAGGEQIDRRYLDKALDFFAAQAHRRAEDPFFRTSFTLYI